MIEIDGSKFESGGAMLRQALGLSIFTGQAFRITNIRAGRPKPGLSHQHLHALNTAHRMCHAKVQGNRLGSTEVVFEPGSLSLKKIQVDIQTAGSVTLLLQTLLLPLVFSKQKTTVEVIGGTDVNWSIPSDYFRRVLVPQLHKFADIDFKILKRGYFPKGAGQVKLVVEGKYEFAKKAPQIHLVEKGELFKIWGISHASADLQRGEVAERQAQGAHLILSQLKVPLDIQSSYSTTLSTGSGITLWAIHGNEEGIHPINPIIIGESMLGERELRAEKVGEKAALKLKEILSTPAACDSYLADQLIPFMAIVGGSIITNEITNHMRSNIYVCEQFLGSKFEIENNKLSTQAWQGGDLHTIL